MRRFAIILALVVITFVVPGCALVDSLLSDVGGLDLTACQSDYGVCIELFFDNADKFPEQP